MNKIIMVIVMMCILIISVSAANGNMIKQQSKVEGLEHIMIQARNQTQLQNMEQLLERAQNRYINYTQNIEDIIIEAQDDDTYQIRGKHQAKFLGVFKFMHEYKFNIDEEGQLEWKNKWYDFLIKHEVDFNEEII